MAGESPFNGSSALLEEQLKAAIGKLDARLAWETNPKKMADLTLKKMTLMRGHLRLQAAIPSQHEEREVEVAPRGRPLPPGAVIPPSVLLSDGDEP